LPFLFAYIQIIGHIAVVYLKYKNMSFGKDLHMKIIHCADVHIDSPMTAHLDAERAGARRNELLIYFKNMVKYAADNGVSAIIIAGDLFDTRTVSPTARNVVYKCIKDNPGITFFYLQGNHDFNSFLSGLSKVPENLRTFGENWKTYNLGESISITGVEQGASGYGALYDSLSLLEDRVNIVTLHGQIVEYEDNNPENQLLNL